LNTVKHDARNAAMEAIRNNVIDSLDITWYDWNEFRTLNENTQMEFVENRKTVMDITNEKISQLEGFPDAVNVIDFVNHIDYLVEKIGIDHVGISSDFDGGGGIEDWSDASETFNVTLELVKRGYTEDQIAQLWSGNLLRVLDEVEAVAKEIKKS